MAKYLKCSLIDLGEMITFGEFLNKYNLKYEGNASLDIKGYGVENIYENCIDFYSEDQIDNIMLRLDDNKELPSGVSIGPEMVDNFIKEYEVIERDGKTTIVHATLANGYKLVESSSCVDPANYSKEIGTEICLKKIKDQIWQLLGFILQTAVDYENKGEK